MGEGQAEVFHKAEDFAAFVALIGEAKERYPVKVLAYCLMSNHFHLLVKPTKGQDLSKLMQWLMTSHVHRYHRYHGTSGHVWQGRFKSFIVQQDDHLLMAMRYVEGNPVRAGMVTSAREWPWSSHRENLDEAERSVIDKGQVTLPADGSAYVDAPLPGKELNRFNLSIDKLVPFGTGFLKRCLSP